jgi:pimeloyl-ACP methyl ester carboxylesterase
MSEAILLAGFEERVAVISGTPMRYFVGGSGSPVVLVHGLGGAATNWTLVAPELARFRRVLVPDLPGHGGSAPASAPEGLWSFAGALAELAEREHMLPAAVVGHSMGCEVALQLAVRRPDAVSALVLVAASGMVAKTWRARFWIRLTTTLRPSRAAARHRFRVARSPGLKRVVFGGWGAHDPPALSAEAVLGFLDGPARARDTATAGRALIASDALADLARVSCPSLVVWGARDRLTPLEHGFEYARRLGAPLRTIPGAGHLVISERPAECAALLRDFLDRVGEVHELPLEPEALVEPGGEGLNAERLGRVVAPRDEVDAELEG